MVHLQWVMSPRLRGFNIGGNRVSPVACTGAEEGFPIDVRVNLCQGEPGSTAIGKPLQLAF